MTASPGLSRPAMLGTTLGPYRIDRELGSGGMGTVYAATGPAGDREDRALDGPLQPRSRVALKVIHPHLVADPDADYESAGTRWILWRATGDQAHLAAARRALDDCLARVPAEHRAAMLANARLNREITAAAQSEGL